MTIAYVYKWTQLSSGKWYIGSRTKAGCHPNDGYLCSSKDVKPLIQATPEDWKREIIATGEPISILQLEIDLLKQYDAKHDRMSFNRHNGDGKFTTTGKIESETAKLKRRAAMIGKKRSDAAKENYKKANQKKAQDPSYLEKLRKPKPPDHGQKVSAATTGVPKSKEHCEAMSRARKGVKTGPCSDTRKKAISLSQKGKPCNNPIVTCPYCEKSGHSGAMSRWHFNNCKSKLND